MCLPYCQTRPMDNCSPTVIKIASCFGKSWLNIEKYFTSQVKQFPRKGVETLRDECRNDKLRA
uniref:HTH araC/xylS-type domain-containing protein n=1 Tax=Heterorhabditis bacteriophora TaxID=37862 RepID=A0A1I7XS57_HETBA